jgi:hypothetical protein
MHRIWSHAEVFLIKAFVGVANVLYYVPGGSRLVVRLCIWFLDRDLRKPPDDHRLAVAERRVLETARRVVERDALQTRTDVVNAIDIALDELKKDAP